MLLKLLVYVALLCIACANLTLKQRIAHITATAPSFHKMLMTDSVFKLARNRAINTVISRRKKHLKEIQKLKTIAKSVTSDSSEDSLQLQDDMFQIDSMQFADDLIPTFDDDLIPSLDDDVFTLDDDFLSFDDDYWNFDDVISFDDDVWKSDDAASSIDGYLSFKFSTSATCAAEDTTLEMGIVAGTCFSDFVASYKLQFSDDSCNGLKVSFFDDTSCGSLLYTVPLSGFNECGETPAGEGTFYAYYQGACSTGYSLGVEVDSVLVSLYEQSQSCSGVPVIYAAIATEVCLTEDPTESFKLTCNSDLHLVSGYNYTTSDSCAANSDGENEFDYPLMCYDSEELSAPLSGRQAARIEERTRVIGGDDDLQVKETTTTTAVTSVTSKQFNLRGSEVVQSGADDATAELFDDVLPSFDDDVWSLDDTISIDDDIFQLDDDFFDFADDDLFNFDDPWFGDDDAWVDLDFSFDVKCASASSPITYTAHPSVGPTLAPQVSGGPTVKPTAPTPQGAPTQRPSKRPTVTQMPTEAVPATVSFEVAQVLYGLSLDAYNADSVDYQPVLIASIAECMTGVTSSSIESFDVTADSTARRLLSAEATPESVLMVFTVSVDSSYDYESLSDELQSNIANGKFANVLGENAQAAGTAELLGCYSTSVTTTQSTTNSFDDVSSGSGSGSGGLSGGAIAGVVTAVIFVVACTAAAAWWYVKMGPSSYSGSSSSTAAKPTETSNAAAASPVEMVSLKDVQLTTAPVFGIMTIANAAEANAVEGSATTAHDNL